MAESGTSRNVFGMKIDMLVKADFQDSLQSIELAANEFKRESVSVDDGIIQLNRNLRSNACILSELTRRFEMKETNSCQLGPLVLDAIGKFLLYCPLKQRWESLIDPFYIHKT